MCAAALTYALIHGGDGSWNTPVTLAAFAMAAAALLVFLAVERRCPHPLLDLALFRRLSFIILMATGVLLTACAFAPAVYTQLWLQSVLGLPAIGAGLVLLPMAGIAFVSAAGHVVHAAYATGQNSVYLAAGIAALAGGVLALAFIRPERPAGAVPAVPADQGRAAGVRAR